jgi:hypothetical protein
MTALPQCSNFELLGNGERVIDLNAEVQSLLERRTRGGSPFTARRVMMGAGCLVMRL